MKKKRDTFLEKILEEYIREGVKEKQLLKKLITLFRELIEIKRRKYKRFLPLGDYFVDRWEKARILGFGKNTSVYDNVVVIGDVKVGENTWIGPGVILDGSGGLEIGSYCNISAGVHIYTHDSVKWCISGGKEGYEYAPVVIEDNCYIGPYSVITKGVRIGKGSIIGAFSLVNRDIPPGSKAFGIPIKIRNNIKLLC